MRKENLLLKSIRKEAIAKGESTTEIDKKIKKYEKKILELNPNFFGGGPNSLPKEPETKDAEPKEKIAKSKLDTDLGVGLDYIKNETKELTAKIAISSISNISAKILELKDEFKNYNPTDINDFLKKVDEIESKIETIEELQDKIDDFLNFNIDNVVNIPSLFDQFLDKPVFENAEGMEKSNEFGSKYSSLVGELKAAGIYDDELRRTPGTISSDLDSMHKQTQQYFKNLILTKFL